MPDDPEAEAETRPLEAELVDEALAAFATRLSPDDLAHLGDLGLVLATTQPAMASLIERERKERERLQSDVRERRDPAALRAASDPARKANVGRRDK